VKCPYCVDDIPDQASVCRSCRRDLAFFIPIRNALSSVEKTLEELSADVEKVRIGPASTQAVAVTLFLVGSPALASLFYWMTFQWWATGDLLFGTKWMTGEWFLGWIAVAAPFPASLWLGACSARLSARRYLLLGLTVGAAAFASHLFIYSAHMGNPLPDDWVSSLLCYLAAGALLCFAGAPLGAKIRFRGLDRAPYRPTDQKATNLQGILGSPLFVVVQLLLALLGPILRQWMTTR
jgi:hypothetical protein